MSESLRGWLIMLLLLAACILLAVLLACPIEAFQAFVDQRRAAVFAVLGGAGGFGLFLFAGGAVFHSVRAGPADTAPMETAGRLLFVGTVTAYLLGRVLGGDTTHPETVVYAATAAAGLDFLMASWRSLWAPS